MIEMSFECLNMLKGNELLLPSTVEWFQINNDSAILRLIVLRWVFTILARLKPHEWPIAEWSTPSECCFWLRQFAWCSRNLNVNALFVSPTRVPTTIALRTVVTRNSINSSRSISVKFLNFWRKIWEKISSFLKYGIHFIKLKFFLILSSKRFEQILPKIH